MTHSHYLGRSYIPELDGLRALAVIGVVFAHMHSHEFDWLSGGRGLDWFYVLSGYLITRLCLKEETKLGKVNLSAFYVRRCCRILPLYYSVLGLYCVLILGLGLFPDKREGLVSALPYFLTLLSELPVMLGLGLAPGVEAPFGHSWSLGVEEKFYLMWPALAFLALGGRERPRMRVLLWLLVAVTVWKTSALGGVSIILNSYANILGGCILAMILNSQAGFERLHHLGTRRWTLFWVGACGIFHFVYQNPAPGVMETAFDSIMRSIYMLLIMAVMGCLLLGQGTFPSLMKAPWLVRIGKVSFGIYLLHRFCLNSMESAIGDWAGWLEPVLVVVGTIALSFVVAQVAGVLIEAPAIRFGRRVSERMLQANALSLAPTAGALPFQASSRANSSEICPRRVTEQSVTG